MLLVFGPQKRGRCILRRQAQRFAEAPRGPGLGRNTKINGYKQRSYTELVLSNGEGLNGTPQNQRHQFQELQMLDLPKLVTVDSKFHLDVPFWLNGIFRTIFKTAKWNPHDNVFVTPATDKNLQKWKKFFGYAIQVAESLKKANIAPYSRVPIIYALTDINAFPLLGGFMYVARRAGWTEAEIREVTKLATSSHNGHLHWVLGVFCLEPSRRFRR